MKVEILGTVSYLGTCLYLGICLCLVACILYLGHVMKKLLLGLALLGILPGWTSQKKVQHQVVAPPNSSLAGLPFSPGILADDFLFLSGSLGNVPGTTDIDGGIEAQTRQTLDNLGRVLKAAGLDFSSVVSANVYLSDARHFAGMNRVFREYFPKDPPARATVEGDIVFPQALVEIALVAAQKGVKKEIVLPKGWKQPGFPFSWGVLAGDTLFVSGMISIDPATGRLLEGDTAGQTRSTLEGIGKILKAAGMDYSNVVSSRVYLNDSRNFAAMNEAYRPFFPKDSPARATVEARLMHVDWKIEIQCVAERTPKRVVAPATPRSKSPFSPGIQSGQRLYLSGMVGRGPEGWKGDIRSQTRQTLGNLKATLVQEGLDFRHVVEANVYLADARHYSAMNEVYRELLPAPPPARSTVATRLMAPEALVEIMMVAHSPDLGR